MVKYYLGFIIKSLYPNPSWVDPNNPLDPGISLSGAVINSANPAKFGTPSSTTGGQSIYLSIIQSGSDDQGNKPPITTIFESSNPGIFRNSDCDVLQGNATKDRPGTLYYDVDYATSQYIAINEEAILNGSAPFAPVQNSNYSTLAHINPRYKGTRSTSPKINVWAPTTLPNGVTFSSINTFGKEPTVSREKTFFAYFDFINGTSPELNNKTIAHVQFLVDQDGNTIPPDSSSLYITQNSFQTGETVFVNLDDPLRFETPMNQLNGGKTVIRGGERVDALLYSDSGSSYSGEIQFDTGSFSVTDYQFLATNNNGVGVIPQSNTTVYTYATGSGGNPGFNNETQTNSQYNNTNGKFTFTSNSDSPVKFKASIDLRFLYASGNISFYIVKNWTSGSPTNSQILDFQSFGGSFGFTTNHTINLDTGFQNFSSGDTVQVVYYSTFGSSYTANLNVNNSDFFQAINQINPSGLTTEDYWHVTASTDIWMTGSGALSGIYGATQYQSWEQSDVNGTNDPRPEFDPIIQGFTVEVGDEIRFSGAEVYTRMVQEVITPSEDSEGLLRIRLNASMSSAANEQHFLLRRYVEDASYVLLDNNKPDGSTSPGTVISEFTTKKLRGNRDAAVSQIIQSNAGS